MAYVCDVCWEALETGFGSMLGRRYKTRNDKNTGDDF